MRRSDTTTVFKINMNLAGASLLALISWAIWSSTIEGWGWGFLSIMLGLNVLGLLLRTITLMVRLFLQDKELAEFEARNQISTPSELATDEDLRKAGMIK